MRWRFPPKKLTRTLLPLSVPGTSVNSTHGAFSSCRITSDAMPMSFSHDSPFASRISPSFFASSIHSRRSV
jgi:hypothetical protein